MEKVQFAARETQVWLTARLPGSSIEETQQCGENGYVHIFKRASDNLCGVIIYGNANQESVSTTLRSMVERKGMPNLIIADERYQQLAAEILFTPPHKKNFISRDGAVSKRIVATIVSTAY